MTDELRAKFDAWWNSDEDIPTFNCRPDSPLRWAMAGWYAAHASRDAEVEALKEGRQRLPAGWKIEVRYIGDQAGLCVIGPPEAGGFAVDGQTSDQSDIRDSVIRALGAAMAKESGE